MASEEHRITRRWTKATGGAKAISWVFFVLAAMSVSDRAVGFWSGDASDTIQLFLISPAFFLLGWWYRGGFPKWLHDCIASRDEIMCSDPRGEIVFRRATATVTIDATDRAVFPFVLSLTRENGKRRTFAIDRDGVRALRTLGWLDNP